MQSRRHHKQRNLLHSKLHIYYIFFILVFMFSIKKSHRRETEFFNFPIKTHFAEWGIDDPDVIDLWYAWVNGSDPEWRKHQLEDSKKSKMEFGEEYFHKRFENHNELLWSLRSVEKNMPWVHNVFLITDNQIPNWIRKDHPKLKIVDHSTLFYNGYHSYDSDSLHFAMTRTPGLSRRVILMDDDMFFLQPVEKSDFFEGNKTVLQDSFWDYDYNEDITNPRYCTYLDGGTMYRHGYDLVHRELYERYHLTRFPHHVHIQIPMDMLLVAEINDKFGGNVIPPVPFRTCNNLQFQSLYISYSYILNLSVFKKLSYSVGFRSFSSKIMTYFSTLPKLACFNVYFNGLYEDFFPSILPNRSSFEI